MQVGDLLWYVPRSRFHGDARFVRVVKVGRKWATLETGRRVDFATGTVDGGGYNSPGRCWTSREAYEADRERERRWSRFRDLTSRLWSPPAGVSMEQINQVFDLLGLPKEET